MRTNIMSTTIKDIYLTVVVSAIAFWEVSKQQGPVEFTINVGLKFKSSLEEGRFFGVDNQDKLTVYRYDFGSSSLSLKTQTDAAVGVRFAKELNKGEVFIVNNLRTMKQMSYDEATNGFQTEKVSYNDWGVSDSPTDDIKDMLSFESGGEKFIAYFDGYLTVVENRTDGLYKFWEAPETEVISGAWVENYNALAVSRRKPGDTKYEVGILEIQSNGFTEAKKIGFHEDRVMVSPLGISSGDFGDLFLAWEKKLITIVKLFLEYNGNIKENKDTRYSCVNEIMAVKAIQGTDVVFMIDELPNDDVKLVSFRVRGGLFADFVEHFVQNDIPYESVFINSESDIHVFISDNQDGNNRKMVHYQDPNSIVFYQGIINDPVPGNITGVFMVEGSCISCTDKIPFCSSCHYHPPNGDPAKFHCDVCHNNYNIVGDKQCELPCSPGEFLDTEGTCFSCSSLTNCQSCEHYNDGCAVCIDGYEPTDGQGCQPMACNDPNSCMYRGQCRVASEILGPQCLTCSNYDEKCRSCEAGFYLVSNACQQCPEGCLQCEDATGICSSCDESTYSLTTSDDGSIFCKRNCQESEFWKADNTCQSCPGDCKDCEELTGECSECQPGFWLDTGDLICKKVCNLPQEYLALDGKSCPQCQKPNCHKCFNITGECEECSAEYFFNSTKCQIKCLDEVEYWSGFDNGNQCLTCQKPNCLKCLNITGNCEQCSEDYGPDGNGGCKLIKLECPKGKFVTENLDEGCQSCGENCLECENITGNCLTCNQGFEILGKADNEIEDPFNCVEEVGNLEAVEKYFTPESTSISLVFSENFVLEDINELTFTLIEAGKSSKITPTGTRMTKDGKKIEIFFDIDTTINNGEIEITSTTEGPSAPIHSSEDPSKKFKEYPIRIQNVNVFRSPATDMIESSGETATTVVTGMTAAFLFFSFPVAIALIKIFQLIEILIYINVKLPRNAKKFIELFDQSLINILPNFFEFSEGRINCTPHRKFEDQELSCSIVNNAAGQYGQVIGLAIIKLLAYLGMRFLRPKEIKINQITTLRQIAAAFREKVQGGGRKKKGGKFKKIVYLVCQKVYSTLSLSFWFNYLIAAQMDMLLVSFINIRNSSFTNFENVVSFLTALVTLIIYLGVSGTVIIKTKAIINSKKDAEIEKNPKKKIK